MGLLDRLRKQPTPPPTPRGASGRQHTSGFLQYDELNAQLRGKNGLRIFEEMWRTDGDVRRDLTMVTTPIAAATWEIDPYAEDEEQGPTDKDREVADFVQWVLFERMSPRWGAHLWSALNVAARSGFAPFETIYARDTWNGRDAWVLDCLDLRRPISVDRFEQDGPRLTAIEQFVPGWSNVPIPARRAIIPAEDLIYYRFGAEGDNWEGTSLLRPAHKHWRYKTAIEEIEAIGIERWAVGVPIAYPPSGNLDQADLDAAQDALEGIRANEQGFILAPGPHAAHSNPGEGWLFEVLTAAGGDGGGRVRDALEHHRQAMSAAVLAEFMRLGHQNVGARATADVQQNPFWTFCEAIATTVVQDTINEQLIPRLVSLNFDVDGFPTLRCALLDSTSMTELAAFISQLVTAGAIHADRDLEDYLRSRADLPPLDEEAFAEQQQQAVEQAQQAMGGQPPQENRPQPPGTQDTPPPDNAPPAKATLARQDRELRSWEQAMSLDAIESAIDGARDAMIQGCGPQAHAMAVDLAAQVARGKKPKRGAASTELSAAISDQLHGLYETGRRTVREELARQAHGHMPAALTPGMTLAAGNPHDFTNQSTDAAEQVQSDVIAALNRKKLVRGVTGADLQAAAEKAAQAALRAQAMDRAAGALNMGRTDQADELQNMIRGARYTSILDPRRCGPCAEADDDVLRPLDDPVRLARVPPNPNCDGGMKCRCLEAFELMTEAPPSY